MKRKVMKKRKIKFFSLILIILKLKINKKLMEKNIRLLVRIKNALLVEGKNPASSYLSLREKRIPLKKNFIVKEELILKA